VWSIALAEDEEQLMSAKGNSVPKVKEQLMLLGFVQSVNAAKATEMSAKERSLLLRRIETAHGIMSSEPGYEGLSFLHSGLCQMWLPHTKLGDNHSRWVRNSGRATLIVQPGALHRGGKGII